MPYNQKYAKAILKAEISNLKDEIDTHDQKMAKKGELVTVLQERVQLHEKVENLLEKVHEKEIKRLQKIIAAQQKTIDTQAEEINTLEILYRSTKRELQDHIKRHAPSQQPKRSSSCVPCMFPSPKTKTPSPDALTATPSSVIQLPGLGKQAWKR